MQPRSWTALAYDHAVVAHAPSWVTHDRPGEQWLQLEAVRLFFEPEALLTLCSGTHADTAAWQSRMESRILQCADGLRKMQTSPSRPDDSIKGSRARICGPSALGQATS